MQHAHHGAVLVKLLGPPCLYIPLLKTRLLFFRPLTWIASNVLQTCKEKEEGTSAFLHNLLRICTRCRGSAEFSNMLFVFYSTMSCPDGFYSPFLFFFVLAFVFLVLNAVFSYNHIFFLRLCLQQLWSNPLVCRLVKCLSLRSTSFISQLVERRRSAENRQNKQTANKRIKQEV